MSKTTRRSVAALLAALGCLLLVATPAGSSGMDTTFFIHTGTIAVDVDGDDVEDIEIELDGSQEEHPCADPEVMSSITADVTGTDVEITGLTLGEDNGDGFHKSYFEFLGTDYELLTMLGDPGTFTPSTGMIDGTHPAQILTQNVVIYGFIWGIEEDCTTKELPTCEFVIDFALQGAYNTTTDMVNLAGEAQPETAACEAPFSSLNEGLATINDLTLRMAAPTT